jgi:polyisoprenoid-binding protein YceI
MRILILAAALAATGSVHAEAIDYGFDKAHTQVHASVSHLGFSNSTARFEVKDGTLRFDPADWASASVDVTIDAKGLSLGDQTWEEHMADAKWFNSVEFPEIRFVSTKVEATGTDTARVTGGLTLIGQTRPVTLDVKLNQAGEHPFSKKPAVGFSGTTTFKRSDFGMSQYVPMVGDEVTVRLEVEAQAK